MRPSGPENGATMNANTPRAMILAAGLGTRLMPLTEEIAKPMVPIVNRPVMEHLVRLVAGQGIDRVCVNLYYHPDAIRDHFGDGSEWRVAITYSHEERLLGTAGGVRKCAGFLGDGTFLVLSGDALTDVDVNRLLDFHRDRGGLVTMVATPVARTEQYGVIMADPEGKVIGFQEKPTAAEALSSIANSGIYVLEPEVLEFIPEDRPYDFGRELFPRLLEEGAAMYAWRHDYYWNDVGSIEEYQRGNFDALEGRVAVDIPGVEVAEEIHIGSESRIGEDVVITPPVCIGDECVVERGARLLGPVIVGPRTTVSAGAVLHRGIKWGGGYIGRDVSIMGGIVGSDSRIEKGAVLLEGAVLGSRSVVEEGIVIHPSAKIATGSLVESRDLDPGSG